MSEVTGHVAAGADDTAEIAEIVERFRAFSDALSKTLPLYGHLSAGIADDPALHRLLLVAPPTQRLPVLLLACVHRLLLDEPDDELADFYPNLRRRPTGGDALPAFRRFCARRDDELRQLLARRSTQTNEVGRCALLLPCLGELQREVGDLGLLDVGTSAGLNLALDAYRYEYRPGGNVGVRSPVTLTCDTSGAVPVPTSIPRITARLGIDRSPVDLADPDEARWLEACVWPEQPARFARLGAAIELVRELAPPVRRDDAVDGLAAGVATVTAGGGHPVVTNTWVLNYLTGERRRAYLDELERLGAERDVSWIYAESPSQVGPELPAPADESLATATVVTVVRWRAGDRKVRHVATAHPHGRWLRWS